jgi:mono/diheme cytochrome c family protein
VIRTDLLRSVSIAIALGLAAPGCKQAAEEAAQPAPATAPAAAPAASAPASAPSANATEEANQIFQTRCSTCHGPGGAGDGPASKGLTPPPRNFTDPAWQASVTDEHIEQILQYGGAAVGKSPAMPSNPDLMSKPDVVAALRAHVRSLKAK